jgi:hypothetical protein
MAADDALLNDEEMEEEELEDNEELEEDEEEEAMEEESVPANDKASFMTDTPNTEDLKSLLKVKRIFQEFSIDVTMMLLSK